MGGNLAQHFASNTPFCHFFCRGTHFETTGVKTKPSYIMQKGQISVQTENIFPIIKKFLYSDHEIFLRELVSNAVDATSKLKTLASKGEVKGDLGDLTIHIKIEDNKLIISDRGIGMSEEEVNKYLNQVAFSSAQEFLEKYKGESSIIGHFGLGFYSAFMVADKVEVNTKSFRKEDDAIKWTCTGDPEYTLEKIKKKDRGTEIVLHINDDSKEFLEKARIETLLQKYCKFLPVTIQFGTRTESTWEGKEDDRKEIKTEVANIINDVEPLWKKTPTNIKDEDYKSFYSTLYPMSMPPLFWIHLNIDYPFNLTGILYFPRVSNTIEVQKNKIQLYSNQVYVTDDVSEIVPEFLTLLHGVIDSPDIPLNVSRSYLQSDANVKKITSYITKKVAEKLNELFNEDRKAYEEKWPEISVFVKYGMLSEEKFHEKALKFALLKTIDKEHFTLDEYKEKIKDTQKDKHDKIIHLYTNSPKEHHSYIQSAKKYNYSVLEMDNIIDNHFMQNLEHKLDDITFVRVDSDTTDNLIQKDEKKESVLSEKEQKKVEDLFKEALKDDANKLELKALSPEEHPILITKPEFMRRMQEMQAFQSMGKSEMPEFFNIVVNTNNPLIAEKLLKMKGPEKKHQFCKYLVDLARLNQNMLKGEELSLFINRSLEFVA
jgi:molecular chaperone HtpG